MPGKRRWGRRRGGRSKFGLMRFRPRNGGLVNSAIVSVLTVTANNVASGKTFGYQNILPDVQAGRAICIHKIIVDVAMAGGTAAAASGCIQGRLAYTPWSEATGIVGEGAPRGVCTKLQRFTIAKPTRLVMGPKLPGHRNWVFANSATQVLELTAWSVLATTLHLAITTFYEYENDDVISSVA